jgi:putative transcriptional regulator
MNDKFFTRKRGASPRLSEESRARLAALSEAEIEASAQADEANPPVPVDRLRKMAIAREVRLTRERLGLSQADFAARFRISLGRLRDYEQARTQPDIPVLAFLRLLNEDRETAERLVRELEAQGLAREYA